MSQSSNVNALALKEEGNALFAKKKYDQAVAKYTDAINHDSKNAILYTNRAACHLAMQRYDKAVVDAEKATEIDSHYAKGWGRLAAAHDALTNYGESIESYQQAIDVLSKSNPTKTELTLKIDYMCAQDIVKNKVMKPETMALPVLMAMARAHDIPVPTPHTRSNMRTIQKAVWYHPKFTTQPLLRLLLILESQTAPLKQIELVRGLRVKEDISKILGCTLSDSVVLHGEDLIAYAKGKPNGVGIGRMHTSYEAFMDDSALSSRPLNPRASALLHRPNTHGPILVMKTTFIKTKDSGYIGRSEDILCWEKLSEAELRGEAFKKLREEWIASLGTGDLPHIIEIGP